CLLPVDIAFRSCDGILIWTHKTMLEHLSEGFPGADLVFTTDEAVSLTEYSLVLRSLFERMHLRKHARLSGKLYSDVFELVEAAEKYLVYSVMASSFRHGVTYDYPEIVDQAAPFIINTHPNEIASRFRNHPTIVVAWTPYRNAFLEVAELVTSEPPEWLSKKRRPHECEEWDHYFRCVKRNLPRRATDCLFHLIGKDITWFKDILSKDTSSMRSSSSTLGTESRTARAWRRTIKACWRGWRCGGKRPPFMVVDCSSSDQLPASSLPSSRNALILLSMLSIVSGCQIPVDLVLQSSDKVLIGAHKANLEAWSDGFPSANSIEDTHKPVDLTETAEILKLLMQGMHKTRFAPWATLSCDTVFALSEAAKKYFVYSVMAGCRGYMYGWPDGQG
ncbi:hypothetical protein DFP72DRAFT_823678, partial [Ephemerocybe angulata]